MLLDDLTNFLQANAFGTIGYDLFKHSMPDTPDDAVCVYEYGGTGPSLTHSGIAYRNPSVQVAVRSKSYKDARMKIESIYLTVAQLKNSSLGDLMVLKAFPNQEPFSLGPADDQGRVKLIVNFDFATQ